MKHPQRILALLLCVVMLAAIFPTATMATGTNSLDNFKKVNTYANGTFPDVSPSDWYYDNVKEAYELGLMIGQGAKFGVNSDVTIAETVTLAARIHSIYSADNEEFAPGTPWYIPYLLYVTRNKLASLAGFDMDAPATRAQYAYLLGGALPDEALEAMNLVADDAIPDVKMGDAYSAAIYKLYRAGILIGNDDRGTFAPDATIRRSEVAAIVTRMAITSLRRSITLGTFYSVTFNLNYDNASNQTVSVESGKTVTEPTAPARDGYEFDGWYTAASGGTTFDFTSKIDRNRTIYAHWVSLPLDGDNSGGGSSSGSGSGTGASQNGIIDVTAYTYEVSPILAPYNYYVYVKTDNPDPTSFCLRDKDSIYCAQDGNSGRKEEAFWSIYKFYHGDFEKMHLFEDVAYEDVETRRVNGGYVFGVVKCAPDGGELVVQQRVPNRYDGLDWIDVDHWDSVYVDTDLTITCQPVKKGVDILIDDYTNEENSLFENLDAVQAALDKYAVYPRGVSDSDKPNEKRPYPFLARAGYRELGLNEWYSEMYAEGNNLLLSAVYPYVMDSLGFPGTINSVAKKLAPTCETEKGSNHWETKITYNGQTKVYGGAGQGGYEGVIYTKRVSKDFLFDNSEEDRYKTGTLDLYLNKIIEYANIAKQDLEEYRDLIAGDTFKQTIRATGGTWICIGREGLAFDTAKAFAYEIPTNNGCRYISNAWVDGRYVGDFETIVLGASFSDFPNANIVVSKMHYTDVHGEEHTQDVLFSYRASDDTWTAASAYGSYTNVPEAFILTRDQVEAMNVDEYSDMLPSTYLIYDGTVYPGTSSLSIERRLNRIDLSTSTRYEDGSAAVQAYVKDENDENVYGGVVWSVDRTDGIMVLRSGYIYITPDASGEYTITVSPAEGASNVTGILQVKYELGKLR
ncbi:MAG: InlB B-repeat-containing protein [Oscillospiraceae bacterium]|nr:InlB B-repeat-containing protein [Oscillospiraceae bacterium]